MDGDLTLIRKMKQGDREAFEAFVQKYYVEILKYCGWHCPDPEEAKDLTQETFVRFMGGLSGYHHKGKAKNYLYTIAGNLCKDYYKKSRKYLNQEYSKQKPSDQESINQELSNREAVSGENALYDPATGPGEGKGADSGPMISGLTGPGMAVPGPTISGPHVLGLADPVLTISVPTGPDLAVPGPESQVTDKVFVEWALGQLSEEFREVVILYYFQDLTLAQIARALDIGLPLVKYRLRQARQKLKKLIETENAD